MAITLPNSNGNSPISADLMYQFYDNKAITPQIRAALQKREDEELKSSEKDTPAAGASSSESKFGPAARVSITDQIIRMNIANNSAKFGNEEKTENAGETAGKKPSRYDALTEIKKRVAADEAAAKEAKDAKLKEIADKIAEAEKANEEDAEEPEAPTP